MNSNKNQVCEPIFINAKKIIYFPGAALRAGVIANLGHPDGVNAKTT